MQEKAVGASDFQQPSAIIPLANERHSPRKLPPQYRFGSEVIGITVRLLSREILFGVVACRVKGRRLGLPEPAGRTSQNIAAVDERQESLFRDLGAGRTIAQRNSFRHAARSSIG